MSNVSNEQAVEWLTAISKNFTEFRKKTRLKKADKLSYVHEQYHSLYLLHRAIEGNVYFVGAKQIYNESES